MLFFCLFFFTAKIDLFLLFILYVCSVTVISVLFYCWTIDNCVSSALKPNPTLFS